MTADRTAENRAESGEGTGEESSEEVSEDDELEDDFEMLVLCEERQSVFPRALARRYFSKMASLKAKSKALANLNFVKV